MQNTALHTLEGSVSQHFNDMSYMSQLRDQMMRFTHTQLRDEQAAEDIVQDALLGAVKNLKAFAGRAAFRSWVFAILKNKIVDYIRKKGRSPITENIETQEFDDKGQWQQAAKPAPWQTPEAGVNQEQFMVILELCLNKLPGSQAQVFMMREFLELETHEICEQAAITESNFHVLIYRARMGLQKCLAANWLTDHRESALKNSMKNNLAAGVKKHDKKNNSKQGGQSWIANKRPNWPRANAMKNLR